MSEPVEPESTSARGDALLRIALVVNAGLALALALAWIQMAMQGQFWRADFTNYYTGWSMVLDGRGDRLYDRELQTRYQERIVPERPERGGLLPFNYPPHLAVPAAAFALLPRESAFYLWDFVQLLLLVPLACLLHRLTPDRRPLSFAVLLAAVLAFPPLFQSFQMGQVSLLVLVCLLGFTENLARGRPFATALWLTLGTIKPQIMVAPVAVLLAGRRWRELGFAAGLFAAWALLATSFLGVSCWFDFTKMLRHSAWQFGQDGIYPLAMYNLKGFLTSLLGEERAALINLVSTAALLIVVLATLWMWRGKWRTGTPAFDLRLALTLQLGLLVNPHFNSVDAIAFVAPALLFYRGLRGSGQTGRVLAGLLLCGPLLFALDSYGMPRLGSTGIHPFFLLMTALAVVMARALASAANLKIAIADAPGAPPSPSSAYLLPPRPSPDMSPRIADTDPHRPTARSTPIAP